MNDAWKADPVVGALANRVLDRLDALPMEERKRGGFSVRLDQKSLPELYKEGSPTRREFVWMLVEKMALEGWGTLEFDTRRGQSPVAYERSPRLRLKKDAERALRELTGRTDRFDPWTQEWIAECGAATWLPAPLRELLSKRELRIGSRPPFEILRALRRLTDRARNPVYLRAASAEAFWGISKALDRWVDVVGALRANSGLKPLLEAPLILNVHLHTGGAQAALFVENQTSFELLTRTRWSAVRVLDIVYAAGFKASAHRVRDPRTASLYVSAASCSQDVERFREWIFSDRTDLPTYFWGDLDYTGLSILKGLRSVFPGMEAWAPGYEPMLACLRDGKGHGPAEDRSKGDQKHPGRIGCTYADTVLLPAIEETGLFCDQEVVETAWSAVEQ